MGYVILGLFSRSAYGVGGAMVQIISHGIISAALFLLIGMIYDRTHTRMLKDYGGLAASMPLYAACFMIATLASIALPGTSGFVGEFLVLLAMWQVQPLLAIIVALGIVLSALYMLRLYRRFAFGTMRPHLSSLADIQHHEIFVLMPLLILIIVIGFYPLFILEPLRISLSSLIIPMSRP